MVQAYHVLYKDQFLQKMNIWWLFTHVENRYDFLSSVEQKKRTDNVLVAYSGNYNEWYAFKLGNQTNHNLNLFLFSTTYIVSKIWKLA